MQDNQWDSDDWQPANLDNDGLISVVDSENDSDSTLDPTLSPQVFMGVLDWSKHDFYGDVTKRLKGPTIESFANDVASWQVCLQSLPVYDERKIRMEISEWDMGIPSRDDFQFDSLSEAYARLVSYRNRWTYVYDIVFSHHEILSESSKSLKQVAIKLSTGAKHDKEANAAFTVQPFLNALSRVTAFKSFLEQVLRNIDFSAMQTDRLMKERQSLAKINQSYVGDGQGQSYMRQQAIDSGEEGASNFIPKPSVRPAVRTRNSRLGH